MRVRFVGSHASGLLGTDVEPRYALFKILGAEDTSLTPGSNYPRTFDLDGVLEAVYRVRGFEVQYTSQVTTPTEVVEADADFLVYSIATVERDLLDLDWTSYPVLVENVGSEGEETRTPVGGGSPSVTDVAVDCTMEFLDDSVDAYFYDPNNELWLPRVDFVVSGAGDVTISMGSLTGVDVLQTTGTFMGTTVDIWIATSIAGSTVDSGSLTITPFEWWEYRNGDGNNPIWDQFTGAQLEDNVTNED